LDLRPDNVLLTPSNDIRIIDFGLAKLKWSVFPLLLVKGFAL
jgi:serine/threonine protein kinase